MISIKVCKLSDVINKTFLLLTSICLSIILYKLLQKVIQPYSIDFIQLSIRKNLCFDNTIPLWKEYINNSLLFAFDSTNLLEEGSKMAEKTNKNDLNEEQNPKEEDIEKNEYIVGNNLASNDIKNEEIHLKLPYLLECEKLTNGKYKLGDVVINDYTKKTLNFAELEKSLFVQLEKDCKILIYHTHTSESYYNNQENNKDYRTENNEANVVRVGKALKEELNQYGIFVRQDTTCHDYPSYNGAYKSSLKSVENILKNENYDIIIDIHRDALASNTAYRPTAEINGETVAKLMFVVGTNAAGLKHDDWIENLKFAIAFQQRANELFPGLFRDLHLSTSRYNQHTSNKTLILEVGATGNTIEEACLAMKYFATVLNVMRK